MPRARSRSYWPERARCAVSLSYDGGDLSHLETVAPCLNALGIRATFYAPPPRILESPRDWQLLSSMGHEIGDYSLADAAGPGGLLLDWTPEMVREDLMLSLRFHVELFSSGTPNSIAYPQIPVGGTEPFQVLHQLALLRPLIAERYQVARGWSEGLNKSLGTDPLALRYIHAADRGADELIALTEQALAERSWLILAFSGVGSGDQAVDAVEHARYCLWLAHARGRIATGTVHEFGALVGQHSKALVAPHAAAEEAPVG